MQSLITGLLRHYQRWLSPMMAPHCRFHPSCSSYAIEAIETHGFMRGSLLSITRIFRCNPFFKGGLDPVPEQSSGSTDSRERRGVIR